MPVEKRSNRREFFPFPVIDTHGHLGPWSRYNVPENDAPGLLKTMQAAGIRATIVSSFLAIGPDWRAGNDQMLEAITQFPGRLYGYAVANPNFPQDIPAELKRCFAHPGVRGIKLHTDFHATPFESPNYVPALEFAHAHSLPILTHGYGSPDFLRAIASRYDCAQFVLAHEAAAYPYQGFEPVLDILRHLPNVYADLCGSVSRFRALERLLEKVSAEKILWGSDTPMLDPRYALGLLAYADIGAETKRIILHDNPGRLFQLKDLG